MTRRRTRTTMRTLAAILLLQSTTLAEPAADNNAAAREHFDQGVAAFEQRRFAEAAKEFRSAYELSPSYLVLYNIGQVSAALGHAVESVDAFQAYLDQGGSTIPEDRRNAVRTELERQRALIGTVVVRAKPDGATVQIDGKLVGKSPLVEPVRLTAGKHSIVVMSEGYAALARDLGVTAGAQSEIDLSLQSTKQLTTPAAAPNPVVVVSGPATQTSTPASTIVNVQVPQQSNTALTSHQRTAGYVLGGLGLVVVGVGAYINVTAVSDASEAKRNGDPPAFNAAKTRNYWGWGTVAAGAVVATTGMVLLFTAPSSSTSSSFRFGVHSNGYAHAFTTLANW